jgi:hypothetical protein
MANPEIPSFASEKEEAEWWDNNPDAVMEVFEQAEKDGTLRRGTLAKKEKES